MDWKSAEAEALIQACADRHDPGAREEFVRRYGEVIGRTIRRVAGRWAAPSPETVADLVQDAYAKFFGGALRGYRHQHDDSDFGFVKAVAANVALDFFRKRPAASVSIEVAGEPAALAADLDRSVAIAQIEKLLRNILPEKSRERDRSIFFLYYRQGLTAKAIAGLHGTGLSVKGVESLLHNMIAALRVELARRPHDTASGNVESRGESFKEAV